MKVTLDQKNYALLVLSICMSQATDTCDLCEDMIAGECETCGTNGADLVDAVSDMILSLKEDLLAAGRKV